MLIPRANTVRRDKFDSLDAVVFDYVTNKILFELTNDELLSPRRIIRKRRTNTPEYFAKWEGKLALEMTDAIYASIKQWETENYYGYPDPVIIAGHYFVIRSQQESK